MTLGGRVRARTSKIWTCWLLVLLCGSSAAFSGPIHGPAIYQYSVMEGDRRVYLWIPSRCIHVRGLIVAFKNLTEQRWLEDPIVRAAAADECLGVVWIGAGTTSGLNANMGPAAGAAFLAMQRDLAQVSGFTEISDAPVLPTGHSATGQFAWTFAQWAPERTIAAVPIKTVPLPQELDLHGVPLLYIVGQTTEWPQYRDGRIGDRDFFWPEVRRSALALRTRFPDSRIAVAVDAGGGHFDWNDHLARLLALYIRMACRLRLPTARDVRSHLPLLRPVAYEKGWLLDSAGMEADHYNPMPTASFAGDPTAAYWVFDRKMALAIERLQGDRIPRAKQMLSFVQDGNVLPVAAQGFAALRFEAETDGVTFHLHPVFLSRIPSQLIGGGSVLGHADEPIHLSVITGPVQQTGPYSFVFALSRESGAAGWIEEEAARTTTYRKAVQPGQTVLKPAADGEAQLIEFGKVGPIHTGQRALTLHATTNAQLPVRFYVVSGPATIEGDRLKIQEFPRGGASTIQVIVVAYQLGRTAQGTQGAIQEATPVTQQFAVTRCVRGRTCVE